MWDPVPTKQKLANAIREFDPNLVDMISDAETGFYDDYESPLATPIHQLVEDLLAVGATQLVNRTKAGEFDATKEEADAWFEREGRHLMPGIDQL